MTSEERFNNGKPGWAAEFGNPPTALEYALAQLTNCRASRDYGVLHGRLHPFSAVAKDSYLKCVERCFANEKRVWEVYAEGDSGKLPKSFNFEYYNSKGVDSDLIGEAPEGNSVIDGYKIKGFGKTREGAGVILPIVLNPRVNRTR